MYELLTLYGASVVTLAMLWCFINCHIIIIILCTIGLRLICIIHVTITQSAIF